MDQNAGWLTWISYSHQHLSVFTILFRRDVVNHLPPRMLGGGRHRPPSASDTRSVLVCLCVGLWVCVWVCVLCHEEDVLETERHEMLPRRNRADDVLQTQDQANAIRNFSRKICQSYLKYPSMSKRINIHLLLLLLLDVTQRKANKPEKGPCPVWIQHKMSLKIQDDQK